jgi:hypothetical protein
MVQGTTLFPERIFPEDAFYTARRLVLLYYRIRDASRPVDRATLVKKLLSAKPFLQGITVGTRVEFSICIVADEFPIQPMDKAEIIGDRPLHVVIRILILGLGQINGQIPAITEKHVADSVVLVSTCKIRKSYPLLTPTTAHESAL